MPPACVLALWAVREGIPEVEQEQAARKRAPAESEDVCLQSAIDGCPGWAPDGLAEARTLEACEGTLD